MFTEDAKTKVLFVGGAPRSGTTLIQKSLDSHSRVYGGPEFDHTSTFLRLRNSLHRSIDSQRICAFLDHADVDRIVESALTESLVRRRRGKYAIVSEKTPWNALWFCDLMDVFPDALFIHVVRDPRGVVSSMLDVGERAKRAGKRRAGFTRNVFLANECISAIHKEADKASNRAPERIMTVRYEDFLDSPEEVSQSLCRFIGLTWDPRMAAPHNVDHDVDNVGGLTVDPFLNPETHRSAPDASRGAGWKEKLTGLQKTITTTWQASVIEYYNYDVQGRAKDANSVGGRSIILGWAAYYQVIYLIGRLFRGVGHRIVRITSSDIPSRF